MKVRSLGCALLLVSCAVPAAQAQPNAQTASLGAVAEASKLVDQLEFERVLDSMFGNLQGIFADNVVAAMERDQKQASYLGDLFQNGRGGRERFSAILGEEFTKAMRAKYPGMKQAAADEYARLFTAEELSALTAFFSSGVGEKWRSLSAQIEAAMGKWGERAGMEAGGTALMNALKRADTEMLAKGNSQ